MDILLGRARIVVNNRDEARQLMQFLGVVHGARR